MIDFSLFDHKTLKKLCHYKKIKTKSLNKTKIIEKLQQIYSVLFIQKFIRRKYSIPNLCPITLEKLVYPFVSIKNPNGYFNYYSLKGITDYYSKTKNFICPNTRYQISFEKIKEITDLYSFFCKKKLKTTFNIQKKDSHLEIFWVSGTLIEYSKKIPELDPSEDTINYNIMPYILNYLYYMCLKDKVYTREILNSIYSNLENSCFSNKNAILSKLKEINF